MMKKLLFLFLSVFQLTLLKADEIKKVHLAFITMPKCGTNLTRKTIQKLLTPEQLQSIQWANLHIVPDAEKYREDPNWKKVVVVRDLRDMCVSAAYWHNTHNNWWNNHIDHSFFFKSDHDGQISYFINLDHKDFSLQAFARRAKVWMDTPGVFWLRFEDLVGEQGGGSRDRQIKVMKDLITYLGFSVPEEKFQEVADTNFGSSKTFRKGTIGQWREEFSDMQIENFRNKLGKELILLGYEDNLHWSRTTLSKIERSLKEGLREKTKRSSRRFERRTH